MIPHTLFRGRALFSLALSVMTMSSALLSGSAHSEPVGEKANKTRYSVFNPTPRDQMRELSTDRPDKTESPFTVDAGRVQIESDIVTYVRDESESRGLTSTTETTGIAVTNLKIGVTSTTDFQIIFAPRVMTETRRSGTVLRETEGFGDITLRFKKNLLGNDEGDLGLGLMAFADAPASGSGLKSDQGNGISGPGREHMEYGAMLPISISLPHEWTLGTMIQGARRRGETDSVYTEWVSTIVISRPLSGDLSGYAEMYSESSSEAESAWTATFDIGLVYLVNPNLQLDAGVNIGVTDSADDLNPFTGVSYRF